MALANPLMNKRLVSGLKAIIFDCDGVLIDSYRANMHYYGMIREKLGLVPMTDAERVFVHTRTHKASIEHIVPSDRLAEAWEIIHAFDSTTLLPFLKRSEGVREFLWWLRDAGFKLAINTSRTDTMGFILKEMDLEGFFFPVMTSGKVTTPKPHPEGVHTILKAHELSPDEVAYIGDSMVDQITARRAGVRFWAYRDQRLDAEVHIEDFWQIKALMQQCYKGCVCPY